MLVCLSLPVAISLAAAAQDNDESGSASSLADADNLLTANKYKQAEDAYRSLLADDQTGDAYAGLAVSLAKQSWPAKILEAEKILRKAKGQFPDNSNLMAAGGYVSYIHSKTVASPAKRDQYLEAGEALCKRAIQADPGILIAQQTLGLVKIAQDDYEEALEPLRKSVSISDNAVTNALLAQALLRLNPKDKEGSDAVDKALRQDPKYYPARLQKAIVLTANGKHEDAFMELRNIPAQYRNSDWHLIEGNIYKKQGDGPAALGSWRESLRQEPHCPEVYKQMAEYYAMRGDGELAIASLHDALEILPNDMPLRQQLAELALRQDKLDVAETEYRTVLASQPDDASSLLGLSRVYFRKARKDGQYPPGWQQLVDQLQNVVSSQNVSGKVVRGGASLQENIELNEGEKALAQNRFREARKHFQNVINAHRDNGYELLTLGEQCFYDGDLKSAEQAFAFAKELPDVQARAEQAITKIVGQRSEALRQTKLGDATRQMPEVAQDHYKQALIADPQFPGAYYGLYSLYGKEKKSMDAELAVNNAVCFLEATDDNHPARREVEEGLERLKARLSTEKPRKRR